MWSLKATNKVFCAAFFRILSFISQVDASHGKIIIKKKKENIIFARKIIILVVLNGKFGGQGNPYFQNDKKIKQKIIFIAISSAMKKILRHVCSGAAVCIKVF